ncbi:histidine kinase N-terminal 7TM domain-containing protein [Halalkalirubrum salinum]|uniref:histidine kinase N-terminal 7TM domain-containing protein n=1 Tax=Halalkalirubrum salinum TaxID=2563889 RepID=UPI0010FAD61D|nr:histidine kinase N-terminal 7TM domain-containing protein [Halalkalirubrum salinum]
MITLLYTGYLVSFALAAVGCVWAAVRVRQFEEAEIRQPLGVFVWFTAVWAASNTLLLVVSSEAVLYVVYLIGLVVGFGTVIAWLWFCSAYTGHGYHYDRRIQAAAIGVFATVIAVKLTNPIHGWYFEPRVETTPFVHFAPEVSVLYWLVTAIAYAGSAVGLYMLFEAYFDSDRDVTMLVGLTVVIALPAVTKVIAGVFPNVLLLLHYEPIGTAIFAVGVVTVAQNSFVTVHGTAWRQLPDRLGEIVVTVDRADRIVEYNAAALETFPELEQATGRPLAAIAPEIIPGADGSPTTINRTGHVHHFTTLIREVSVGPHTVGRVFVLTDVTELERKRSRLEQQAKHAENLTEAMAHELRNPLTIVLGQLARLQKIASQETDTALSSADARAAIDSAHRAAERIEVVTDDLISITRHGTPIVDSEPYALRSLLEDAWQVQADPAVRFTCELPSRAVRTERERAIELFEYLFRTHKQRGATKIGVQLSDNSLVIESDGAAFQTGNTDELFRYGVETEDQVRLALANARTLATLHGWSIAIDQTDCPLAIRLSGLSFVTDEESSAETAAHAAAGSDTRSAGSVD